MPRYPTPPRANDTRLLEALRESEDRFRLVVETAYEGICTLDIAGRITYANTRLATMLGRADHELIGQPIFAFMEPQAAFEARTRFAKRQRGISDVAEVAFRLPDGAVISALESASSMFDREGEFTGAVCLFTDITDRAAAERRLRESERYFRALTESSSEIVVVMDADGIVRYANASFFHLLDLEPNEVLGRPAFDFVAEEDRAHLEPVLHELLTKPRKVVVADHGVRRRDGTTRALSAVGRNLLDDPAVRGIVVNASDVTERRRAEHALQQSETRFEHVVASVPGMVYQYEINPDWTGNYTYVSEGARMLFGVDPEDALRDKRVLLDLIHPAERDGFRVAWMEAAAELTPFRWEGRVLLPHGEERFIQIVAQGERQSDGRVLSSGIITDVTALHQATHRLTESEQRFRSLFEHNPDAVFSLDLEGHFLTANPAFESVLGRSPEGLLGTSFDSLVDADDRETVRTSFRSAVDGTATCHEVTLRHSTGRAVRLEITSMPIVVGGDVVGVFGIAKDLTAHRELEQQLLHAQKMEAVGRLAGGIAHDFNNLLTVISGYTHTSLQHLPPGSKLHANLGQVAAAGDRAAALTKQLLAFSRKQVLKPIELDANGTVAEVARMLSRIVGEDIAVQTDLAPGLWKVHADPGQVVQVVMNLAVNARDAMPSGGTIRLRTANVSIGRDEWHDRQEISAGEYVALVVEDTGTGIDPAVRPHIFDPFFTTKGPGHGTGLGLATVYGIVKQSGGHVRVDSEPGEGSTFTVLLPRLEGPSTRSSSATPGLPKRGTETILLVEDEAAVRQAVEQMLSDLGYTVLTADSVEAALLVASAASSRGVAIHLVLTDVVMPEENGRALGERLKRLWPGIPVLYMSGYTDDEILRRGLAHPGTAFLEKPFTLEKLAESVRGALAG